ncbi:MaoC/PaaZ C-terminal domain-containing protein [uncultured Microbacterium sp.]|uniref:MaoC/PaaZ C-terminal domain-containing protein n=1 Tax=uncultured Microbacterium sp. TaxID=191216 RepID=UPI0035CB41FD
MSMHEWAGRSLGQRTVGYSEGDAILYALAVGASPERLDLVFEDHLRVLPTFALTLAQWAPDVLAAEGVYGARPVHGAQSFTSLAPLPRAGEIVMSARVADVWDKATAAVFEIVVESDYFAATWSIFAPGVGDFRGDRGPARAARNPESAGQELALQTAANQAALYRLTGDRHHIHVDPTASRMIGQPRPIMHGLCTLVAATLPLADQAGAHPADLTFLHGRFSGPVVPGDRLAIRSWDDGLFDVARNAEPVIVEGKVNFS